MRFSIPRLLAGLVCLAAVMALVAWLMNTREQVIARFQLPNGEEIRLFRSNRSAGQYQIKYQVFEHGQGFGAPSFCDRDGRYDELIEDSYQLAISPTSRYAAITKLNWDGTECIIIVHDLKKRKSYPRDETPGITVEKLYYERFLLDYLSDRPSANSSHTQ